MFDRLDATQSPHDERAHLGASRRASKVQTMLPGDSAELRKQRGAFFTPYPIAEHLASWALRGDGNEGLVLDPTCGEGVFLLAAADQLSASKRTGQTYGVDLHKASLNQTARLLVEAGHSQLSTLLTGDFFAEPTPGQLGARLPFVDAVVGNPPFVRYHEHRGETRRRATAAALAQGVRLSGLASSWAALLVHSSAFLKPDGRIAMVLPAELLSVGYAEPIRRWLRQRFSSVHLVLFEQLQFADAEEQVVLLVARGSGGCNAFTLHQVRDADELERLHIYDADAFAPQATGKWTDLFVPEQARGMLRQIIEEHYTPLGEYATVELGTVTGANDFFTMSEATRQQFGLLEGQHVVRCVPPGSRHLTGVSFTAAQWEHHRLNGARVWLLNPKTVKPSAGSGLARYIAEGERLKVNEAYKCTVRTPWWRPPVVGAPDFFFTYMSHTTARLVGNAPGVTLVNSLHGVTLRPKTDAVLKEALPLLGLNTVTMLAAEVYGRAYGGGILKMEPSEAALLPLPALEPARAAWSELRSRRGVLDELVRAGNLQQASVEVDTALLTNALGMSAERVETLRQALRKLRNRRQRRAASGDD